MKKNLTGGFDFESLNEMYQYCVISYKNVLQTNKNSHK